MRCSGGNSGPNLGVGITGADRYNHYATETGIIQETQEEGAWVQGFTQVIAGQMPYNISRRYEAVIQQYLEEAGVLVLKRHYARRPIVGEDGAIQAVLVEDLAAFQTVRIDIKHAVIEASGDGEIGALAGADFDVGSEAQSEFGERSAPPVRTNRVQGTSLVALAQKTDHEVVYIPPPGVGQQIPRVWEGRISSWLYHHDRWLSGLPKESSSSISPRRAAGLTRSAMMVRSTRRSCASCGPSGITSRTARTARMPRTGICCGSARRPASARAGASWAM